MDKLAEEIAIEREYITQTLSTLRKALERPEKSDIELTAIGACLHHCYNGIENILKRVLKFQKILIPDSPSSHKDLLDIALQQGLISDEVSENLDSYRGFRHFFVHGYGAMLREEDLEPLALKLPDVWSQFYSEIEEYIRRMTR